MESSDTLIFKLARFQAKIFNLISSSNGQEETVEENQVRWLADEDQSIDLDQFQEGDFVEVRHRNSDEEPEGWCKAKIISKDGRFLYVHYESYENVYDEIVLVDDIRQINDIGGPLLADIHKETIEIPPSVIEWCSTQDWLEKLDHVFNKTNLLNISYRPDQNQIVVIGRQKPVNKAKILASFIIAHQTDLAQLDNDNQRLNRTLEAKRQKAKNEAVEEVLVDKDFIGLIIGKGGSNISYIKQEYGVGIQIVEDREDETKDSEQQIPRDKTLVRIYGKDAKSVNLAKREVFIKRVNIPIEASKIEYVKGYQNTAINDMREKSKCFKVFLYDPEKNSKDGILEVIGNEDSIDSLKSLLDTHMSFFNTYQEKDNTARELDSKMNKLNSNYPDATNEGESQGKKTQGNRKRNKKY